MDRPLVVTNLMDGQAVFPHPWIRPPLPPRLSLPPLLGVALVNNKSGKKPDNSASEWLGPDIAG